MQIQIITNHDNGAGLEKDAAILSAHAKAAGHTVNLAHIHRPAEANNADLNIFLEVVVPGYLRFAPRNWLVPNSEWYCASRWDTALPRLNRILCKTADSVNIWGKRVQVPVTFIGWEAVDRYRPDIPKEMTFLHLAGKSLTKNTSAVMDAWKFGKIQHKLTVVAFKPEIAQLCHGVPNVELINRLTDEEVTEAMNRNRFLVMPSRYEGYGHAIHEALGCKSVVITTDGAPMNQIQGVSPGMLAATYFKTHMGLAVVHHVAPDALARVVNKAASMADDQLNIIGDGARVCYTRARDAFHTRIAKVLSMKAGV